MKADVLVTSASSGVVSHGYFSAMASTIETRPHSSAPDPDNQPEPIQRSSRGVSSSFFSLRVKLLIMTVPYNSVLLRGSLGP